MVIGTTLVLRNFLEFKAHQITLLHAATGESGK